jgi:hypothetical protein
MGVVFIGILIFVLTFGAGAVGLAVQRRLPTTHKSDSARGVVGQIAGLISLLLALVLGTMIGVSFAYFSTQKTGLETFSAQILRFDQALKQFGPEAQPMRDGLKEYIGKGYQAFWGGGDADPALLTVEAPLAGSERLMAALAKLDPKTDAQKAALATASSYLSQMEQSRLIMSLQVASQPVSWVLIAILVFWTAALFFGIGLFAESNPVVLAALAFGAVSIAFAIFLILELGMPYTGLFRVPPAALEQTLQYMGK